jgi:protein-ribulosamine 3-kinase
VGSHAEEASAGEYESCLSLLRWIPNSTPKPILRGCWDDSESYFVLFAFYELETQNTSESLQKLAVLLARLHENSKNASTKFGFPVPTYHGKLRQDNDWADDWKTFFASALRRSIEIDHTINGPIEQISELVDDMFTYVIPALLGRLENGNLAPCLLHGDLWLGNSALNATTKEIFIFDPSPFWGHNEC